MNDDDELPSRIKANIHRWAPDWAWRDKPIAALGAARTILQAAGIRSCELRPRDNDPPDCKGWLDGQWSAIEVTELVHEKTRARSVKAIKERDAGREPKTPEAYFDWDRVSLLNKVQELIEIKDGRNYKGGPYKRYVLVIPTSEYLLDDAKMRRFLEGETFRARRMTDVIVGLGYEPASRSYPVFRLKLTRS
jgi:hypothetical protein